MTIKIEKGAYLTKSVAQLVKTEATEADMTFQIATDEEIKKQLNMEEIPDGFVAGWASTSDLDSYGHIVEAGAFQDAINKRGLSGNRGIRLLREHKWNWISGIVTALQYASDGRLWIAAQMNLKLQYAAEIYEVCKMTGGLNFSVGFYLEDYKWEMDKQKNEFLRIIKGDLFEVSIVPFPANEKATMEIVKSREAGLDAGSLAEFEKALVADGLVRTRTDANKITLAVKKHAHLFKVGSRELSLDPPAPLLATELVQNVSDRLAELKKILAN